MAFQPAIGTIGVVVRGTYGDGTPLLNTFHYEAEGVGDVTQDLADTIAADLASLYNFIHGYMANSVTMHDVVVTDLRTEGAPEFVSTNSFPVHGLNEGQPLPFQTAACVSWITAFRGKSFRGRSFFGGFAEQYSDGKSIDAALVTALGHFGDGIVADGHWKVLSRVHDKAQREVAEGHIIRGYKVNPHWRSQRRRQYS